MIGWLLTFVLTLIVEIAIAWPVLGLATRRRRLAVIVLANLVTHPIVYTLTSLPTAAATKVALVIGLELGATLVEALVYHRALRGKALPVAVAASCLANAGSLVASAILAA